MTENKIDRKIPVFWLISLSLIIIAFIIYFRGSNDNRKMLQEGQNTASLISNSEKNKKIADFVSLVEDTNKKMGRDHAFTNEALVKLSEAVNSTAGVKGYEIQEDLGKVRELAANITKDSLAKTHADNIRKAADILTDALQDLQKEQYPLLKYEVEDLRNACVSINPRIQTLNQKVAIKTFFNNAANLMQKMK